MPKFNLDDEQEIEVTPTVATKEKDEVVPENVVTLTSGVRVQFLKRLSPFVAQQIVISSFNDINLDSSGRVRDNMSSQEQLATAKKMYDFNAALLINGLLEGAMDVYGEMPKDTRWLAAAKINPLIKSTHPFIDFNDSLHMKFIYLFYHGFVHEDDYQILSEKLLDR